MKLKYLILLIILAAQAQADAVANKKQQYLGVLGSDVALGEASAPVIVIEYSSLSCPSCAFFHNKIFSEIEKQYINPGLIRYVHRNYPLNESAVQAAYLPICGGRDKYYLYLQSLFNTQSSWASARDTMSVLAAIAALGGMSNEQFDQCMANKDIENQILQSRLDGHDILAVNATPTFFIGGEKVAGVPSKENLFKMIEQKIADAKT